MLFNSYVFLGRFLPLMLVSTTVDFVAARLLSGSDDERFRRLVLTVSLATNLGLLGFFKYATFFFGSLKGLGTALVGLWHGAAWTFVVWGIVHGAYLSTHALLRKAGLTPRNVAVNRLLTFVLVVAAFVIFRAEDLGSAGRMLMAMVGLRGLDSGSGIAALLPIGFVAPTLLLLAFVHLAPDTWDIDLAPRRRYGFALGCAAALAVMTIAQPHPFIYFQF